MQIYCKLAIVFIISIGFLPCVLSSQGDQSPFYKNCVKTCMRKNCTDEGRSYNSEAVKYYETTNQLFVWYCLDECRYDCMWHTVEGFKERGYEIPKFHGKWPFQRFYGIQEPGSALASFLNLAVHVYMHVEITRQFPVERHRLVLFWHFFVAVCVNGWVWSIIFHVKDNPFTEFMDYAGALSMVTVLYASAVIRAFHKRKKPAFAILFTTVLFYIDHIRYLYFERVDYGYNMIINFFIGTLGSVLWVFWSITQCFTGNMYAWRVGAFAVLSGLTALLEVMDFPPLFGWWDAHALWHLSTAPLPVLFYRFVIDDLTHIYGIKRD